MSSQTSPNNLTENNLTENNLAKNNPAENNTKNALQHKALMFLVLPAIAMMNANAGESTIGVGISAVKSPYVSNQKNKIQKDALIDYTYVGERLNINKDGISYDVFKQDDLDVFARVSARQAQYHSLFTNSGNFDKDNKALEGMEKHTIALEAGMGASYMDMLNVSFLHDVNKAYKGYEVDANAKLSVTIDQLDIQPLAGITYMSKNLVNYHYGVSAKESKAGRPAYTAKSSINPYLGITATYPITQKIGFVVGGKYEFLGDAIKKSPIVDKKHTAKLFSKLTYTF